MARVGILPEWTQMKMDWTEKTWIVATSGRGCADVLKGELRAMGYDPQDWEGKPVIGIINTWSDAQPCHMHFKDRVEWVKRGVLQAGALWWGVSHQKVKVSLIGWPRLTPAVKKVLLLAVPGTIGSRNQGA